MKTINLITKPIEKEFSQFNSYFHSKFASDNKILNLIIYYIVNNKGKQIRPILVFLSSKLFGEINNKTFEAATLIEMLHTATLVHDDIVDESYERRGTFSVNALWKSKKAVLIGDYILSRGMITALENKNYDLLHFISEAVGKMSIGELKQVSITRINTINLNDYIEVISNKTACLFSACLLCGGFSNQLDISWKDKLEEFGLRMGLIFQIKDDINDYKIDKISGKPKGNDIKDLKFTLPLILTMNKLNIKTKIELNKYLFNKYQRVDFKIINNFISENNGFDMCYQYINTEKNKLKEISQSFPKNEILDSIFMLIDYIIEN